MTSNQSLPSSSSSRRWDSLKPPNRTTTTTTTTTAGGVRSGNLRGIDNEHDLTRRGNLRDRPHPTRGRELGWETSTQSQRRSDPHQHRQYGHGPCQHHHHQQKYQQKRHQKSSQRMPISSSSVQQNIQDRNTMMTPELFLSSLESRLDKIAAMAMPSAEVNSVSSSYSSFWNLESNERLETWILSSLATLSTSLSIDQVANIVNDLTGRIRNLESDIDVELLHTAASTTDHKTNNLTTTTVVAVMMAMTRGLACIVRTQIDNLSAEHTAQTVVGEIFLPFLEGKYDDTTSTTVDNNDDMMDYHIHYIQTLKSLSETMKCLLSMYGNKSHASAILCPLTEGFDQNDDGKEVLTPNPIRIRLLQALSSDLILLKVDSDHHSDDRDGQNDSHATNLYQLQQLTVVSELLAVTLQAVRKIDDPGLSGSTSINNQLRHANTNTNASFGLNQIKVQEFLIDILGGGDSIDHSPHHKRDQSIQEERQRLRISTLRVLNEIIAVHPTYLSRLGWKLLVETNVEYTSPPSASSAMGDNRNLKCDFCRQKSTLNRPSSPENLPYLLLAVHSVVDSFDSQDKNTINESILAIECLSGLLGMMPWNAWIGRPLKTDHRIRVSRTAMQPQQSSMSRRVVESLERIGRVLYCTHTKWIQRDENVIHRTEKRATHVWMILLCTFFREVPFVDDSDLNGIAQSLWESIALVAPRHSKGVSIDVMFSSLGGSVTPSGVLEGACIPARSWLLQTEAGSGYLSRTIREIETNHNGQLQTDHAILEAVLRSVPDVAIQHWEELDGLLRTMARSREGNSNILNLRLLKALSIGRLDFGFEVNLPVGIFDKFLELVCVIIGVDTTKPSAQQQRLTLDILASLDGQDWRWLQNNKPVILREYSQSMIECTNSTNAGVREASCKAIGQFCSTYATHGLSSKNDSDLQQTQNVSLLISESMMSLLEDKKTTVRSMSLHVLGNLAVALRESNHTSMINNYLIDLSRKTLCAIEDSNTKVKVNAIRSLGHLGFLVAQNYGIDIQMIPLLCDMTLSLTSVLKESLDIMSSGDIYQSFTSKQRIAARKYGWGACNSLGHIFHGYSSEACCSSADGTLLQKAISSSFLVCGECLSNRKVVNNKVFHAAIKAITSIHSDLLFKINTTTGIVGDALIASIGILFEMRTETLTNSTIESSDGIDSLLIHLLAFASTNDVLTVLKCKELEDRRAIGDLYSWMVDQPGITADTFLKFSNAFQGLDDDPKLANSMVASDTMLDHMFSSRASMIQKEANGQSPDDDDDDEDEL